MKRTYKPLSLVYLLVTSVLVFQGTLNAEGPVMESEGGRPTEVVPVETDVEKQREEQKEEAIAEQQGSREGEIQVGGAAGEEGNAPSLTTGEEEKTTVTIGDVAKRYIQQAQEKGISVASSLVSKAQDVLNTLRTQLQTAYNKLRVLIPLTVRLSEEQKGAFGDITNQVADINSLVDTTLRDVENFKLTDQNEINGKLGELSNLTTNLLIASRDLIENSDRNSGTAQDLNNQVKIAVLQTLLDVRNAIRALSDPSYPELTARFLSQIGKNANGIKNLAPRAIATT